MDERVIFHVDMNAFFASVEQQYNPALRGTPIIVCGNPKSRTVVAACSYEAKAFGITNGMAVHEARRLCPGVRLVSGTPEKYVDVARRIFAVFAEFTNAVEIASIDEAFLDVTGASPFFGDAPEALARRIKQRIRAGEGLTCSVGIAPNKLLAKLASNLQKPDGLVRIRAGDVAALMARLPVETLCGVGARLKASLNELGIITCQDLGQAPEEVLTARFGVIGAILKQMGQGRDDHPVVPTQEGAAVKSMGHAYTLPRDTANPGEIYGTVLRLAEQVARRLRADGYQGRTVGLTIRYADFSGVTRHATQREPTDAGLAVCRAAIRLFERHCEPIAQRVRLIGVSVSGLTRRERQLSFLEEDARLARLDRTLDRLNDRFGECTVVRASAAMPLIAKSHGFLLRRSSPSRGLMLH